MRSIISSVQSVAAQPVAATECAPVAEPEPEVEEIVLGEAAPAEEIIEDEHSERAASLAVGTWLEVTEQDGSSYRAKLSWRSNISGRCLFVNRKGMKVAEVSPQALATWFRGGSAVILEQVDVPLMDRALSAMVKVLKETEKPA